MNWKSTRILGSAFRSVISATHSFRVASPAEAVDWGKETKKRFMVTVSHGKTPDNHYQALVPEEIKQIAESKPRGVLLSSYIGSPSMSPWNAFLLFRENSVEAVREHLKTLPLASYLNFVVTELMQS